jgi:hypothetical protein
LAPYRISGEGRPGLLFGYATLGERALSAGAEILAEAIADVRSRQPAVGRVGSVDAALALERDRVGRTRTRAREAVFGD